MGHTLASDLEYIVRSCEGLWETLRNRRLLITGGTGFFGSWILESFAWANNKFDLSASAAVLTRNPEAFRKKMPHLASEPNIGIYKGDVRTFDLLVEPFDFIIHAAAPVDPKVLARDRLETVDTIVNGTRQILQHSIRCKAQRLLYISSGAVYGAQPTELQGLSEHYNGAPDITKPSWAYGEAKRYAEMLCTLFHESYGVPVVIARPFTFVGPYQDLDASFAVTQFIRCGLRGVPIRIEGDGTPLRSYCYAADLAVALWKILLEGKPGSVYNVGSEEVLSILELAHRVVMALGIDLDIFVSRQAAIDTKPVRYVPDITRLKSELGFRPQVELDVALKKTINWARETHKM